MTNPDVQIDLDVAGGRFVISGGTLAIKNNRRVWFYLKSAYKALDQGDSIWIPFEGFDKETLFADLEDLFKRHAIQTRRTTTAEQAFAIYLREEENFAKFAVNAKKIWDNEFDRGEFKTFLNVLSQKIPGRSLYDLQLLAAYHLAFSQNACNFSVPGAGKTTIVYAAYAYLNSLPEDNPKRVNKIVVIGPLSAFGPWELEYEICFGHRPRSQRLSGGVSAIDRVRCFYSPAAVEETPELLLLSYQGAAGALEDLQNYLKRPDHKVMLVLDEAHRIKNTEGGVWAETALELARYPRSRVILTGTPAPNGYQDLYNLFKFIWPQKSVIGYSPAQLRDISNTPFDARIGKLVQNVSPFFVRIKKSHLRLPVPVENPPQLMAMGNIQKSIYDYLEGKILDPMINQDDDEIVRNLFTKAKLIRLMQAASNPALLLRPIDEYFGELPSQAFITDTHIIELIKSYDKNEIPPKYRALLELTKKTIANGETLIIWAIFVDSMHRLSRMLDDNGIPNRLLYGQTPVESDDDDIETRESIIKEFHSPDSRFKVLIANPFAVGESISLHKACHRAVYMERNFNAGMFIQSKDRIHRVGLEQDDKINYHYLVSKDSIEETIHRRLQIKEARMMEIIESQEIPLIDMNMENDQVEMNDVRTAIDEYKQRARRN